MTWILYLYIMWSDTPRIVETFQVPFDTRTDCMMALDNIGADSWTPTVSFCAPDTVTCPVMPPLTPSCPEDVNGDGFVGLPDQLQLNTAIVNKKVCP